MVKSSDDPFNRVISDPAFQLADSLALRLTVREAAEDEVSDYLVFEIARSPRNLKNHMHRIWLQYDREEANLLFAALFDLWLALGGSGNTLFKRMLLGSETVLEASQFKWLLSLSDPKILRSSDTPEWLGSVLDSGFCGRLDCLDAAKESEETTNRDPLQEARECLEYSQVEQAQELLENALVSDSLREALHLELLDIYKSTRDLAALKKMQSRLKSDVDLTVLGKWEALADQLSRGGEQ
jgi:hypothetical protein